jgi:hypothetical protein
MQLTLEEIANDVPRRRREGPVVSKRGLFRGPAFSVLESGDKVSCSADAMPYCTISSHGEITVIYRLKAASTFTP